MSKITTQHCKDFLQSLYPDADVNDWKRVRKFNGDQGQPLREFSHPDVSGNVFVLESAGALSVTVAPSGSPASKSSAPKKKGASKYVYSVIDNDMEHLNIPNVQTHVVMITNKNDWQASGYMNDQPDYEPAKYMPKNWDADDVNECGTWVICCQLNEEEVIEELEKAGFVSDSAFDQLFDDVNGRSAKNSAAYAAHVAKKQNNLLTGNVAPQLAAAPTATAPKI